MKKIILFTTTILIIVIGLILLINNSKKESTRLIELSGSEFKEKIENKDSFILLIKQTDCSHCKLFEPTLETILEENTLTAYSIDTQKLNEEDNAYLDDIAKVNGTPTTIFIIDGIEETSLNRIVGNMPKVDVENRLKSLGYIE